MSNHRFQPSLVRVLKQLSRQWKAVRERERDADDDIVAGVKNYHALPVFTLIRLIHDATSIPANDLEWVAAFIDTPLELTPWKNPEDALPGWMIDPELDGLPYDKVDGENLKYLRSIREELHKCDDDGRAAEFFRELESKHPGVLDAVRTEEEQRRTEKPGVIEQAAEEIRLTSVLGSLESMKNAIVFGRSGEADTTDETAAVESTATLAEQTDPVTRAIALLLSADKEGKPIVKKDLPAIVGCSRSKLYRDPQFNATVKALKAKKQANIPKGSKTKEGNIEAEYDPAEE